MKICKFHWLCVRNPASRLLQIDRKFEKWQLLQFSDMTSSSIFLTLFCLSCQVCQWSWSSMSKFHVNIITGSGVMTIFFYKGLTRNPEIGNIPAWVLPNIWRLGQIRNTEFGSVVSEVSAFFRVSQKCPVLVPFFIGYYGYCFIKIVNSIIFY